MKETEYDKNLKQAVKSEENISQAIELIKRDYRNGIMPSLRNMHKLVSDIMLVKRYCQDFYTVETLRMTLSVTHQTTHILQSHFGTTNWRTN